MFTAVLCLTIMTAMPSADLHAASLPSPTGEARMARIDFATGAVSPWHETVTARVSTPACSGSEAGDWLALPESAPSLPARGSRFSTLMRARDVFDVGRYPARVVAKLHRLDADGRRQGTACTAQFVGPRHMLTAAHCVADRTTGRPHAGFEIALRYDAGMEDEVVHVTHAWIPVSELEARPAVIEASSPIDHAADCHDIALIRVSEPAGAGLGWLGMSSLADDDATLHRFSYPNESSAATLERQVANGLIPEDARPVILQEIDSRNRTEPDFSPDNLYYEYGPPDEVHAEALSERNGAVLPGRSGSALINAEASALGVMSRAVSGVNYSCRLTPDLIGAFASIIGDDHNSEGQDPASR